MEINCCAFSSLCELKEFNINGKKADYNDFGEKYDHDSENADDYGCGDMRFDRKESTKKILKKYKIDEKEYQEICDKLESELSFGGCGWCI